MLAQAQATAQGRARIALAGALGDLPGWFNPLLPEPAATDFAGQEMNQFLWDQQVDFPFAFALRAELEARAQGNVSWNTGVDYRRQLDRSIGRDQVRALYQAAGLDLDADLTTLNDAARISADPEAVQYLERNIIFDGEIHIPVLTLHTKGDGLVVVQNESAYKKVVDEAGNGEFLRRTFVDRAGHCAFTPAETIAAVQTLVNRLDTGRWQDVHAIDLNKAAATLGPGFNIFSTPQAASVSVAGCILTRPDSPAGLGPFLVAALVWGLILDASRDHRLQHEPRDIRRDFSSTGRTRDSSDSGRRACSGLGVCSDFRC